MSKNILFENNIKDLPANEKFESIQDIEGQLASIKKEMVDKIQFRIILKPLSISFAALFITFFIDLSYVPILGNISANFAKSLFPGWQPINQSIEPISFWWMPLVAYAIFVAFAYKTYKDLKEEVIKNWRTTSSEIIDRLTGSSISVVDGISTALPLIGAAILLISVKLGPEVFLGLSVPFEIKALIILALGKLFEPVFDTLGVEFQHVINRAAELKEKHYSQLQMINTNNLLKQVEERYQSTQSAGLNGSSLSVEALEKYNQVLQNSLQLTKETYKYINASKELLETINSLPHSNEQRLQELKAISSSLMSAAESLKDENTIIALKSLENIVKR